MKNLELGKIKNQNLSIAYYNNKQDSSILI